METQGNPARCEKLHKKDFSFKMPVVNEAQGNFSVLGKEEPQGPVRYELTQRIEGPGSLLSTTEGGEGLIFFTLAYAGHL